MNRIVVGFAMSPCCSGQIILSANDELASIPVCDLCRNSIDLYNNPIRLGWIQMIKEEQAHLRTIKPEDLGAVSMEMRDEEDDTTICGVLKTAYQKLNMDDYDGAKENIKKAIIYGRRMNTALEEYKATGVERKEKPQEEVDRETKKRFSTFFQERS